MKDQKNSPGFRKPGRCRRLANASGAFTLIELLIVVAIIAILAAIAVPNFLEAQTRAKVSRVKSDARSLATAVESYRIDWNRYAPREKIPAGGGVTGIGNVQNRNFGNQLGAYTSPIAYMTSLPNDVFERRIPFEQRQLDVYPPNIVEHLRNSRGLAPGFIYDPFDTANGYRYGYLITSVGPDGRFGNATPMGNYPPVPPAEGTSWNHEYDPTNGTVSLGNVYRFSSPGANGDVVFN